MLSWSQRIDRAADRLAQQTGWGWADARSVLLRLLVIDQEDDG